MTVMHFLLLGFVFLKIVLADEVNTTFGIADDVTPGTLVSNYVLPPPEDTSYMKFFTTNNPIACSDRKNIPQEYISLDYTTCMCDDQCGAYDDCCIDAPSNITKYHDKIFECVILSDEVSIYMATSCPSSFKDVGVVKKCKLRSTEEEMASDITTNLPVTDMKTNITYGNIYCAKCNGVDESSVFLKYWRTKILCTFQYQNLTERLQHVKYDKCTLLASVNIEPKLYERCKVYFEISPNVMDRGRKCVRNLISSCSPDRKDGKLEDKCSSYMSLSSARNFVYRNEHCALCRGVDTFDIRHSQRMSPRPRKTRSTNNVVNIPVSTTSGDNGKSVSTNHSKCAEAVTCKNMDSLPPEKQDLNYMNCRCDNDCYLYNDCCPDAPKNNSETIKPIFECVTLANQIYVYMVTKCPITSRDPDIVYRCKGIATEEDLKFDLRMDVPVTDLTTNITYANIYCAKCSGVDENSKNLAYWPTNMYCQFVYNNLTARATHVVPSNTSNENRVLILDNSLYENCTVKLVVSDVVKSRIRYCVPNMIDSCSNTNVYQDLSESCSSGYMQYVIAHGFFFRNRYCTDCLLIQKEEISICPIIEYEVVQNRVKRMVMENDATEKEYEEEYTTDSYSYDYGSGDSNDTGDSTPKEVLESASQKKPLTAGCDVPFSCSNISSFPGYRSSSPYANCYCDAQCSTHNDCCPDLPPNIPRNSTVKSECVQIEFGQYAKMIVTCPETWKDHAVADKCISFTRNGELTNDVPITDLRTNYTYGNAFCAECNGVRDNRKNLVSWKTHLNCTFSYVAINDRLSHIRFNKEEGRWKLEFEQRACRVSSLVAPKAIYSRIHRCTPAISSCSPKWNDSEVSERCANYTTFIFSTFLKHLPIPHGDSYQSIATYRNKDCAKCNYQLESKLTYCSINRASAVMAPFILLFKPPTFVLKLVPKINGQSLNLIYEFDDSNLPKSTVTFLGIGISIIFLSFHFVIFFKVKELQNLSGKCLTSYSVALIIGYISFLFWDFIESKLCSTIAIISYYAFLSAFLWMFAMSYDVFISTYKATSKFSKSSDRSKYNKFIKYSIFCWGTPLLIIVTSLLVDLKSIGIPQPSFGQRAVCWFGDTTSMMYYFVLPCFIILVLNIIFFSLTSYLIFVNRNSPGSSKKKNCYVKFALYGRLAILMGLTWIVAVIAFVFSDNELWTLFTVLNTTQGIFIFFSFSFKKPIRNAFLSKVGGRGVRSASESQFTTTSALRTEEIEIK